MKYRILLKTNNGPAYDYYVGKNEYGRGKYFKSKSAALKYGRTVAKSYGKKTVLHKVVAVKRRASSSGSGYSPFSFNVPPVYRVKIPRFRF